MVPLESKEGLFCVASVWAFSSVRCARLLDRWKAGTASVELPVQPLKGVANTVRGGVRAPVTCTCTVAWLCSSAMFKSAQTTTVSLSFSTGPGIPSWACCREQRSRKFAVTGVCIKQE
eukprot:1151337-Pelagomonas_calceolata.AAC.4